MYYNIHVRDCTLLSMPMSIHFCYYSVSLYTQQNPNDEAVQMPVPVHMCTSNLKMASTDKLDSAEVTAHPPNANGDPPTTVVPTEPVKV